MLNKAVINLETLRNNALNVKRKLKKGVLFNAVVKADGYGHGAVRVASALYKIVDSYSVALVEEGVALRRAGIDKEILVLVPLFKYDLSSAVYHRLTPTVSSVDEVVALERECEKQNREIFASVKFNTGMNRFGVDSVRELNHILEAIKGSKRVKLSGMFSHFADAQNKKAVKIAQNKFLLANNLVKGYNNNAVCHISASGGFCSGIQADMVRIGILLYGYKPFKTDYVSVKPVMKIYAPVVGKRVLNVGESALYGFSPADKKTAITLVRYGYADGLSREEVGALYNNRCMDVSALVDVKVKDGMACVMLDAEKEGKLNRTISYEVLCKSASRAEKIYID